MPGTIPRSSLGLHSVVLNSAQRKLHIFFIYDTLHTIFMSGCIISVSYFTNFGDNSSKFESNTPDALSIKFVFTFGEGFIDERRTHIKFCWETLKERDL